MISISIDQLMLADNLLGNNIIGELVYCEFFDETGKPIERKNSEYIYHSTSVI